ncbi:hypothetical protein EK904_001078 [Melospiza melodia maxima]|nr:hypothetical protein EK904_001078 [Melospiza melodia maxima]
MNYLPVTDMRIARTFCFTNEGQALYLSSPTEIQRLTYSQEMCDNLQDMLGDLFTPVETPEAQNRGFLKGLFGGSGQAFDREELFGEATAGKASRSLAQHIPGSGGIEGVRGAAGGVIGDLTRARIALDERGQKLGELDERTASMMASAEAFSKHAHEELCHNQIQNQLHRTSNSTHTFGFDQMNTKIAVVVDAGVGMATSLPPAAPARTEPLPS